MLLWGLAWALVFSVPAGLGGLLVAGVDGLRGWAMSLAVVGAYFAASVIGDAHALRTPDMRALGPLLAGFVARAGCVVLALHGLEAVGWLVGRGRVDWFAWTTVTLVCGWSFGIIWARLRTRSFIYDGNEAEGAADE
ncbi:MAG: hypothetical protein E7Z97_11155 [Propionibacteriaceae bacterium]|uniref:ATP synthase protein I n=1 Tax=Propionibacterium ruminifibrarum TaxID=1962131 RepID=A0A375HZL7_9ACTN|nr:hypothetical protein [Propionibacterium ruminifibrarum]MBE6478602.1 hypothetical protein [Propionibacteriaceae bacterium]SPF67201.1 Hypothetical protein PROPJV5_0211 [Propionibacterium ruminifibrarum]